MTNSSVEKYEHFNVFPAMGYWEIEGKPVSSRAAEYGAHPKAVWKQTTEIATRKQLAATAAIMASADKEK